MGMILDISLPNGLSVKESYARIGMISGSKDSLSFSVDYYISRDKYLEGLEYLKRDLIYFKPSVAIGSQNFFKQAYLHTKTLDVFKEAKDVFEEGQA